MAPCHHSAGGAHVIRRLPVASLRGVVRAVGVYPLPRFDNGGGVQGARGQAARVALYLFERDAAVAMMRSG